jgi:hypothetical protein
VFSCQQQAQLSSLQARVPGGPYAQMNQSAANSAGLLGSGGGGGRGRPPPPPPPGHNLGLEELVLDLELTIVDLDLG